MYKEAAICIITVIAIIVANILTENYTKSSVDESTKQLYQLKEEILLNKENEEGKEKTNEKAKEHIDIIHKQWDEKYNVLAFYLEHNELEKIETELTGLRASIETEEYEDAINELDKTVYLLKHIEEKNKMSWKNIF
ncbi:MAG: DUF4363 family protein [Clostridia bacterium]|nr:DUF4363 family protein [Clostridia bacterium]